MMKKLALCYLLAFLATGGCKKRESAIHGNSPRQGGPLLTRAEVLRLNSPDPDSPGWDRSRLYAEADLTDNGLMDIIISDDLHMMGTGGIGWSVYLCEDTNRYRRISGLAGKFLAVEENTRMGKKLWTYWSTAGNWGTVQHLYFDRDEGWKLSADLTIHPGDGGSDIGQGIFDAIFNEHDSLKRRKISPASPTNDLPYVDTPWD